MLLRARTVVPVSAPPIADGAVLVRDGVIAAVGSWADLRDAASETLDLGEVVLLPGLINAHCHLDYTGMAGQISPGLGFADWVKSITMLKGAWTEEDFRRSWLDGAAQLLLHGTTTVADIEAVPALLPAVWDTTPLRVHSFLEMTGVKSRQSPEEILAVAAAHIDRLPAGRCRAGLSPHAPYSTVPELLRRAGEMARQRGWRVTTHVAESLAEFDMFMYRRGAMFDWLRPQRDMADCGAGSPVGALAAQSLLGDNFLAVHVNHLWQGDAPRLAASGSSAVHCPRSHAYFGHRAFPFQTLTDAGVNVCLGTDSAASLPVAKGRVPELSLFDEMRAFAANFVSIRPETILRLATVNAARALGRGGELGELTASAAADLITVPHAGGDVFDAILRHTGPVRGVMIAGVWAAH